MPFEYFNKGAMATVGRNLAVVDIPKLKFHFCDSRLAGLMGLHLVLILCQKPAFAMNWLHNYFTHDQSLRLLKEFYRMPDLLPKKELAKPKAVVKKRDGVRSEVRDLLSALLACGNLNLFKAPKHTLTGQVHFYSKF